MVNKTAAFLSLIAISVTLMERQNGRARYSGEATYIRGLAMSAFGISAPRGKGFSVSASADIRHDQLVFERQQSLAMRNMEWEGRVRPLLPWSTLILRVLGGAVLASVCLAILI